MDVPLQRVLRPNRRTSYKSFFNSKNSAIGDSKDSTSSRTILPTPISLDDCSTSRKRILGTPQIVADGNISVGSQKKKRKIQETRPTSGRDGNFFDDLERRILTKAHSCSWTSRKNYYLPLPEPLPSCFDFYVKYINKSNAKFSPDQRLSELISEAKIEKVDYGIIEKTQKLPYGARRTDIASYILPVQKYL